MVQVCPLWSQQLLKAEGTSQRARAEVRDWKCEKNVWEQLNLLLSEVQGEEERMWPEDAERGS